jgi:hypothetical protein
MNEPFDHETVEIMPIMEEYAARPSHEGPPRSAATLQDMLAVGASDESLLTNAQNLHADLTVRLARRAIELRNLPYGLSVTEPVRVVASWYQESFQELVSSRVSHSYAFKCVLLCVLVCF